MSTRDELLRPALLINYLQSGGAERLVKDLAIKMQEYEGIEPIMIVANSIEKIVLEIEESDIELVSLRPSISTLSILHATWRLCHVLQDREIDVVYPYLPSSHVVSRLARGRRQNIYASTYHDVSKHVIEGIGRSSLISKQMEVLHEAIAAEKLCVRSSGHHYIETESLECVRAHVMKVYESPLDTLQKGSAKSVWMPCSVLNVRRSSSRVRRDGSIL